MLCTKNGIPVYRARATKQRLTTTQAQGSSRTFEIGIKVDSFLRHISSLVALPLTDDIDVSEDMWPQSN